MVTRSEPFGATWPGQTELGQSTEASADAFRDYIGISGPESTLDTRP